MRRLKFGATAGCFFFFMSSIVAQVAKVQSAPIATMSISGPSAPVRSGQPLVVMLTLSNHGTQTLKLDAMLGYASFDILIRPKDGHMVAETEKGCKMHMSTACHAGPVSIDSRLLTTLIPAGESVTLPLDVSYEYVMAPGIYEIQVNQPNLDLIDTNEKVSLLSLSKYASRKLAAVLSNSIVVQVLP